MFCIYVMKCRFEINENEKDTLLLLFCTILICSPNFEPFFISILVSPIHTASSHNFTIRLPIIILLCSIGLFINALTHTLKKIGIQRWVMAIIIQMHQMQFFY